MLEKQIEAKCVRWAKARGTKSYKLQGPGNRSAPDRLFILPNGRVVFIEFKRPGGRTTALQAEEHLQLTALGHAVRIVDNFETFKEIHG